MIRAPDAAKRRALAAPNPDEPPVMIATLSLSRLSVGVGWPWEPMFDFDEIAGCRKGKKSIIEIKREAAANGC